MSSELDRNPSQEMIEVPAPTPWPMITAFGITLLAAGLVTHGIVSLVGLVLALRSGVGWFREDLPVEHVEFAPLRPVIERALPVKASARTVAHLEAGRAGHRVRIPAEIHPYSSGLKGGIVGGVAMAIVASAYGLIAHGSIWYPINLLASVVYAQSMKLSPAELLTFHADSFAIAVVLHGLWSTLVGVLYGAMLPMLPRRPIVLGGLVAPVLWSGALHSILGLLNPLLQSRIDWTWFIASQVAFGIVAGLVVLRQSRRPTRENVAFALRAGIEAPGILPPRGSEGARP
jgi:hypothetical protein